MLYIGSFVISITIVCIWCSVGTLPDVMQQGSQLLLTDGYSGYRLYLRLKDEESPRSEFKFSVTSLAFDAVFSP